MMKLIALIASLTAAVTPCLAGWPEDKPIEVVVGFAPGGGTDSLARQLLPFVQKRLGPKAQFIVVNKPGAAGEIALTHVGQAKSDGYTLAMINLPSYFFVPMTKKSQYDPSDFRLIARVVDDPTILVVRNDSKLTSLSSLIDQSKKKPGSVTLAHTGTGTNGDLAISLLGRAAAIELNPIAYKGASAQRTDLLGGHIDGALFSSGEVTARQDGSNRNFRAIVQFTSRRSASLPNVQTALEVGYKVTMTSERGFAARKDVPTEILERLRTAVEEAMKDPEYLELSTDKNVLSYLPGAQWEKTMKLGREALRPLAGTLGR